MYGRNLKTSHVPTLSENVGSSDPTVGKSSHGLLNGRRDLAGGL
jgi:hypothetical protein